MLPGVEVARKRRIHHHHDHNTRGSKQGQKTIITAADSSSDVVLLARQRLERKLRGSFFQRHTPVSSTSPRWMQLSGDVTGKEENHGRFDNSVIITSNCSDSSSIRSGRRRRRRRREEEKEDQRNGRTSVKSIHGRIPKPFHWSTCRKSIRHLWKSFSKLIQRKKLTL